MDSNGINWGSPTWGQAGHNVHAASNGSWDTATDRNDS